MVDPCTYKKMKILLCAPYGGKIGGISRWTDQIINHYNSTYNYFTLEIFSLSRNQGVYSGDPFLKRFYLGIKFYIPLIIKFFNKISSCDIDIVHITTSASFSLIKDVIMLKITKHYNKKTILHLRFGRIPQIYKRNNWEQKLLHIAFILSDKVIVIDRKSYDVLISKGYDNIVFLPNPLFKKVVDIYNRNKFIKREERKILFAGHIIPSKGVFELVKACKRIDNIKLVMIGFVTSRIKTQLLELAGNNNKWLEFHGELNSEDTIIQMISANIFILPSYTEGFPNVILESMACGCPIIASNVGAIPDMLNINSNQVCGICIEPKNIDSIQKGISKMLSNKSFANSCTKNAQNRVNEVYSISVVWEQLKKIWDLD